MYDNDTTYTSDDLDERKMAHGVELARQILSQIAAREEGVFSDVNYHDSALLRTGRELLNDMCTARQKHEQYLQEEITRLSDCGSSSANCSVGSGELHYGGEFRYGGELRYGGGYKPVSKRRQEHPFDDADAECAHNKLEQMHALSYTLTPQERASRNVYGIIRAKMFYTQACFMKDYADTYARPSIFASYLPTYNDMSDHDLRAYFTWRHRFVQYCEHVDDTKSSSVQSNTMQHASSLQRTLSAQCTPSSPQTPPTLQKPHSQISFIFVYAYELLCNVHDYSPKKTFEQLRRLHDAYVHDTYGRQLSRYLTMWMLDYALYNNLPEAIYASVVQTDELLFYQSVAKLRQLEDTIIAEADKHRERLTNMQIAGAKVTVKKLDDPRIIEALCQQFDAGQLTDLLVCVSGATLKRSTCYKQHPQRMQAAVARVFVQMVLHCQLRRKQGFIEGLFGKPTEFAYTMFESAIFYAPAPHADQRIQTPWHTVYTCLHNQWSKRLPCPKFQLAVQLADILCGIEQAFCELMPEFTPTPLAFQKLARYQKKYIFDTVQHIQVAIAQKEAQAEASRITIDATKLGPIRKAAALTCEALLVDEEREAQGERGSHEKTLACEAAGASEAKTSSDARIISGLDASAGTAACLSPETSSAFELLTPFQQQLLVAVLNGGQLPTPPSTTMLSIEIDKINETLFDQIGDSVLTMDNDGVQIVEDYRDEVEEFLGGSN